MGAVATVALPLASGPDECGDCTDRLRAAIAGHDGVLSVELRGTPRTFAVRFDPAKCSRPCLERAVLQVRHSLEATYAHAAFMVEGMDCGDCARTIERAIARMPGVTAVSVRFPAGRMSVEYQPAEIQPHRIHGQVARLGYRIPGAADRVSGRRWPSRLWVTAVATALTLVGVTADLAGGGVAVPLYAAAALLGGAPIARAGLRALAATRRPEIKILMTIAAIGAAAIGAWAEAALVVVLFSVGEVLEGWSAERARRELASLVDLTPPIARVRHRRGDGPLATFTETEVPVAELAVGDVVVVRPGERIPVDGVVRAGTGAVDQAAITGESVPVEVEAGIGVFAGTMNQQGMLVIEATRPPGDTTLARIGAMVAEAQARRSPSERWVDAFARRYTPAVIAVAVAVAVLPPWLLGTGWGVAFYDALALLILACPCALVLSTPVTVASALARATAAGVLVKGGSHLEAAAAVRTVALDKTGTLTAGRPAVTSIHAVSPGREAEVLGMAAAVEAGSEHPLAAAITRAAVERGIASPPVGDFEALVGVGAAGVVDGRRVTVGDASRVGAPPERLSLIIDHLRNDGQTVVAIGVDGEVVGVIGIADTVRPEAAEAVASLHAMDVRTVMLTGDHPLTAAGVAARVGVERVHAGLLPDAKAAYVDALTAPAMVGDGVNDAPALAAASVGIAMGTVGSDTALEAADVAVMGDDLRKVPGLIGLARWARAVVRQNIWVSLTTKAAAAVVLAGGALPLWGAVVADVGASLLVVGNGLRLVRGRPVIGPSRGMALLSPGARPRAIEHVVHEHKEPGRTC